jgi:hypothetical protein
VSRGLRIFFVGQHEPEKRKPRQCESRFKNL